MIAKTLAMAGLASLASAHIVITNPVPYGASSLTNGPLDASGSDFPCKQRAGVYEAEGASNVYKQGSKQQLAFKGTAVHGGGSCQVSVTKDLKPTKDSVWKVIKSIEGGCPAQDQAGNMGNDANAEVPYKYDFTIPEDLKAGEYTIAWTWFNKIGNREMYMNCAPMTVQGSGGKEDFMDSLPDMFVANIGNGCSVKDSTDVQFPNPGKFVDKKNGQTQAFAPPQGTACAAPGGSGGSSPTGGSGSAPTDAPSSPPQTSAPAGGAPPAAGSSLPGGVFVTVPTQAAGNEPAPTQPADTEPAPTEPAVSPAQPTGGSDPSAPPAAPGGSSGGNSSGSPCSNEGEWNCIGGTSFQRCASGTWSAVQPMAAGVNCAAGQSSELKMSTRKARRAMRRAMRQSA